MTEEENKGPDLKSIRIGQDFHNKIGVAKKLMTVQVRKPPKQAFVRVHPDPEHRANLALIEFHEDREIYVVSPDVLGELEDVFYATVATAITRQGNVFLWYAKLPKPDGRVLEWHKTALEAMDLATEKWTKVSANMSLGAYEASYALADLPEPEWPDYTFEQLVGIAFKERFINSPDHLVVKKLRGEQ